MVYIGSNMSYLFTLGVRVLKPATVTWNDPGFTKGHVVKSWLFSFSTSLVFPRHLMDPEANATPIASQLYLRVTEGMNAMVFDRFPIFRFSSTTD